MPTMWKSHDTAGSEERTECGETILGMFEIPEMQGHRQYYLKILKTFCWLL